MEHKPEVGDTVVLRGKVLSSFTNAGSPYVSVKLEGGTIKTFYVEVLTEVIPKPWEPKVGDKVTYTGTQVIFEYRATVDDQWVLKNPRSGSSFITSNKDSYTKAP